MALYKALIDSVKGTLKKGDLLASDYDEIILTVSADSQVDFSTAPYFTFDASVAVRDIVVYRNVGRQYLASDSTIATGHYYKTSSSTIRFLYALKENDKIIIARK